MTPEKSIIMAKHARSVVINNQNQVLVLLSILTMKAKLISGKEKKDIPQSKREKKFTALFRWAMDMRGIQSRRIFRQVSLLCDQ